MAQITLSKDEQEQVNKHVQLLQEHIKSTGNSQSHVAKEMGISSAQISAFLNNKYKSPLSLIPRVEAYLNINQKKQVAPEKPGFQMTSISRNVTDVMTICQIQGVMGVVYGDAGVGKTEAAMQYCREYPEAIMITVSPVFANVKGVNELLCEKLKVTDKRTNMQAYMSIVKKLRHSNRLVIVDEAQHLTINTLEHLRSMILDDASCGLVLMGNEVIYSQMTGRQESQLAQLFSRIAVRKNVLTSQVKYADIELLFPQLDEKEKQFMFKISNTSKWGIRGAVNLYVDAASEGDVSIKGLTKIARFMGIGGYF